MTDEVKHKCGIALVRLLKPLEHYQLQYGSWRYGLEKLYLLMEKQRNRGLGGAGLAYHYLPALLCCGGHILRVCHGDDSDDYYEKDL